MYVIMIKITLNMLDNIYTSIDTKVFFTPYENTLK